MTANPGRFSFACQHEILLAPGGYFHAEHSGIDYPSLPQVLQEAHNQRLLRQYQLPAPDSNTLLLPDFIAEHWAQLPKVAWALGVLLHPAPLPWWVETSQYAQLHQHGNDNFRQLQQTPSSPQTLLAAGAAQLLAGLQPFGKVYTARASYMFSSVTRQLMETPMKNALPWNVIEGACRYVAAI
ncbi:hypothetical protein [Yersinia enterocolitica]|uniref:Type III secretion apparatus protein OrgA/MxiK n=1 Tax=Yersinia enterocolitica serotype O:8 / biotype 1B (strain NCTC 13174 / 8081) TaxID=393305 RepID=A1JQB7_YERE8|nr:hypothetical protein [Yersinia enterocolitica]AJJ24469.1 bacterial type III secretion apparatus family protein [Yersinia enterocolitica]CAL13578.1 hypothetical protein YE3554 [Yersinia enterocolitica subsp. enterocolitica 8081]CNF72448.1 type III secretion apparatus protein OrgA/MxiK [Yersinia enterocolitica]CRY24533.1 type III secretion apparatus protein OrgA/MxiK [Yersinia enterocolitica]HDL8281302.1 hypothetical protein [Yersinia enterocolitica]